MRYDAFAVVMNVQKCEFVHSAQVAVFGEASPLTPSPPTDLPILHIVIKLLSGFAP
jgi:hypothetical protein